MNKNAKPLLANNVYDMIKYAVQVGLPAIGALYFGLSQIWGFPYGEEVVGSVAVITLFLGTLIKVSNRSYETSGAGYDGRLTLDTSDGSKDVYSIELNEPFEELHNKTSLNIKVDPSA